MSAKSVGFVLTEDKDFWKVLDKVVEVIAEYNVFVPNIVANTSIRYAEINFSVKDKIEGLPVIKWLVIENRSLSLHFNCDSDYSDVAEGSKIIWSLGDWGKGSEIVMKICQTMKEFGEVHFIENDGYEDWIEVK